MVPSGSAVGEGVGAFVVSAAGSGRGVNAGSAGGVGRFWNSGVGEGDCEKSGDAARRKAAMRGKWRVIFF
jgi:hypothetical protein